MSFVCFHLFFVERCERLAPVCLYWNSLLGFYIGQQFSRCKLYYPASFHQYCGIRQLRWIYSECLLLHSPQLQLLVGKGNLVYIWIPIYLECQYRALFVFIIVTHMTIDRPKQTQSHNIRNNFSHFSPDLDCLWYIGKNWWDVLLCNPSLTKAKAPAGGAKKPPVLGIFQKYFLLKCFPCETPLKF